VVEADFSARISKYRARVDAVLERYLPSAEMEPAVFHQAMRYSVLGSGKRVRPLLAYATAEVLGVEPARIDPIAASIEFVHAYSLVHDDLPAMDDDDLRRGRPTTHVAYDEAIAILVGDALQALAFQVLATDSIFAGKPDVRRSLVIDLSAAIGSAGMVGGQAMDLAAENQGVSAEHLDTIYALKTGRLIRAAIVMPCRCKAGIRQSDFDALARFAEKIGVAFQVKDDLLEVEESTQVIGKNRGSDEKNAKATYPGMFGWEAARDRAELLYEDALAELDPLGSRATSLRWLSDFVVRRNH
jgi:geranylgeranyl pyrophosphate synthase